MERGENMMDLLLVRHGEPDYSDIDERGYIAVSYTHLTLPTN